MTMMRDLMRGMGADLLVMTLGALFLAFIGPFGSYLASPLWQRILFQLGCFWIGTMVFGVAVRLVVRRWPLPWRYLPATIVVVAIVNIPFSRFTHLLGCTIWPIVRRVGPLEWYLQGLVTAEVAMLVLVWLRALQWQGAGEAPLVASSAPPLGVRPEDVLCLQMEDHYVRVHDMTGSRLVLTTMSQAITALGSEPGVQVHRSWWVARTAVARAEWEGRNLRLCLANDLVVPVARSAVARVREVGLLPDEGST
jgi:hypothetical protein